MAVDHAAYRTKPLDYENTGTMMETVCDTLGAVSVCHWYAAALSMAAFSSAWDMRWQLHDMTLVLVAACQILPQFAQCSCSYLWTSYLSGCVPRDSHILIFMHVPLQPVRIHHKKHQPLDAPCCSKLIHAVVGPMSRLLLIGALRVAKSTGADSHLPPIVSAR